MASDTEYVPVIDDQFLVLYLDRFAHPDLANRYELKPVNPHRDANNNRSHYYPYQDDNAPLVQKVHSLIEILES